MVKNQPKTIIREIKNFLFIAIAISIASFGWCAFILPHKIPIGGIAGFSSVVFWGVNIPVQYTYFTLNIALLLIALKILGWKFCVRTIFAVVVFTIQTSIFQALLKDTTLFSNQPFLACVIGGALLGIGTGIALQYNASTGGSDVIAAMINKHHDVSLGKVILACDLIIITSGYVVLKNWENIIYGYITLFVMTSVVDYVINGMRGSVQFFVVSEKWQEIGNAINNDVQRGCTLIDARGFYTGKEMGMLFILARRTETREIFQVIDEIDPEAFISQSSVNGVYGIGFDRMKVGKRKKLSVKEA
ncbi:YitT family protein [Prevotella brunnea]|uniref:YitT family protein n=1 Tax=Prevotella brunnea TaxID=2508867 RepID=A0A5C8G5R0_9BACT|nr:YitT family protein [Prevotella brunnea]MDR0185969.1 YitT family protein [Prevotella brunnea]TXJ57186.1 YitT family protein [Prevotella brunnea]